jgi:hypothetical protein
VIRRNHVGIDLRYRMKRSRTAMPVCPPDEVLIGCNRIVTTYGPYPRWENRTRATRNAARFVGFVVGLGCRFWTRQLSIALLIK